MSRQRIRFGPLRLAVALLPSLLAVTPAVAEPAVAVLFDQSLADSRAEPHLAEQVLEMLAGSKRVAAVTLAGFDEDIRIQAQAVQPGSEPWKAALLKLRRLSGRERHADFEPALRHLAEDLAGGPFAILISHGAPEVWGKRISPTVKADDRYRALNDQYRDLTEAQATKAELLDLLGPFYRERNAKLAAAAAARLRPLWGERLLVWDTSGNSAALKAWCQTAGARYLAVATDGKGRLPTEIRQALTALLPPPPPKKIAEAPPAPAADPGLRPWMHVRPRDHDPSPPARPAPRHAVETIDLMRAQTVQPPPPEPPATVEPAVAPPTAPAPTLPSAEAVAVVEAVAALALLALARPRRRRTPV